MATPKAPRAVLYLRQSRARDDSISIEIQEAECRAYCARVGYDVVLVVAEEGVSAYRDYRRRPHFHRVMEAMERGEADVVVVYRWSRLSRRRLDQVVIIDKLGRVESANEPIDVSTAGGRFSRDMMLGVAAFESEVKSEQFKEALQRRADRGLPKDGQLRFGYRKVEGSPVLEPDPLTGPVLADAYRRYIAGAGFQQLCKWLNDEGHTSTRGGKWIVQSLLRALDSGFGAGLLVHDRRGKPAGEEETWTRGAHDPVITDDEWEAYRAARKRRRVEPPKRRTATWHLSGLVFCGYCEGRLTVTTFKVEKSQALCASYHSGKGCRGVWIKRQHLEREVAVWLGGRIDQLAAELPQRDEERARAQNARDEAQRTLDGAVAALGRLAASHARGLIDDESLIAAQSELTHERDAAAAAVTAARAELERLAPPEDAYAALESAPSMTPGEFATLIGRVLRRVDVTKEELRFQPVVGAPEVFARRP